MGKLIGFKRTFARCLRKKTFMRMSKALNLGSYDDVKAHAAIIYDRIRGIGGTMVEVFAKWMAHGYQL